MKKTSEELYKTYRVCALHFSQEMFLNDLQNRLQSNAVPIREHNMQEKQEDTIPCNITSNQSNCQEPLELPLGKLLKKISIPFILYYIFSFPLFLYMYAYFLHILYMYSSFQLLSFVV